MKKQCFKCGEEKFLSDFYKHPGMKDGHLNKCKECNKKDVRKNRSIKLDYYRQYDRDRAMLPHRVDSRISYSKTENGKKSTLKSKKRYRKTNPEKYKAHSVLNNAVQKRKIDKPKTCSMCGKSGRIHGHHHDYSNPLDVVWVCAKCHTEIHKQIEIRNEIR